MGRCGCGRGATVALHACGINIRKIRNTRKEREHCTGKCISSNLASEAEGTNIPSTVETIPDRLPVLVGRNVGDAVGESSVTKSR